MNVAGRRYFFSRLRANNPNPTTELKYANHYQLLIAVVLSAQATDKSVNAATKTLFRRIKKPADTLALGEHELISHIRGIGLYRTKARHIMRLSDILLEQHAGRPPKTLEDLQKLPGVGRKNGQCDSQYGLWKKHHCRGYACFSRSQPHRIGAGERCECRGRTLTRSGGG